MGVSVVLLMRMRRGSRGRGGHDAKKKCILAGCPHGGFRLDEGERGRKRKEGKEKGDKDVKRRKRRKRKGEREGGGGGEEIHSRRMVVGRPNCRSNKRQSFLVVILISAKLPGSRVRTPGDSRVEIPAKSGMKIDGGIEKNQKIKKDCKREK